MLARQPHVLVEVKVVGMKQQQADRKLAGSSQASTLLEGQQCGRSWKEGAHLSTGGRPSLTCPPSTPRGPVQGRSSLSREPSEVGAIFLLCPPAVCQPVIPLVLLTAPLPLSPLCGWMSIGNIHACHICD